MGRQEGRPLRRVGRDGMFEGCPCQSVGEELDWTESQCMCFVGWLLFCRHAGSQKEAE